MVRLPEGSRSLSSSACSPRRRRRASGRTYRRSTAGTSATSIRPTTAWAKAKKAVEARIPELAKYRGHLGDSSASLRKALDTLFSIDRDLQQVSTFAMANSDVDTRAAKPREMRQAAEQLAVDFDAASSWIRPELLTLDAEEGARRS